jgi:hypothetical protein
MSSFYNLSIKKLELSNILIFISLLLIFSLLYQVYFYGFESGNIEGGEINRFVVKVSSTLLLLVQLRKYMSVKATFCNLKVKAPIYFICINYIVLAPLLEGTYIQVLNSILMLPILFIDWSTERARSLYFKIFSFISIIIAIQLIIEPFLRANYRIWENGAFIGGVGNPNSFGVMLILSGIFFIIFFSRSYIKYIGLLLILSTIFTGSLASVVASAILLFVILTKFNNKGLLICMILIITVPIIYLGSYMEDIASLVHLLGKSQSLLEALLFEGNQGSESISLRAEYTMNGLNMLIEYPVSIIFGHPNFLPMYNGDGLVISFLVTFGLPFTLYFICVNFYLLAKSFKSKNASVLFSSLGLMVFLIFFISNRILDYWPMSLPYFLFLSFLASNIYSVSSPRIIEKIDVETQSTRK